MKDSKELTEGGFPSVACAVDAHGAFQFVGDKYLVKALKKTLSEIKEGTLEKLGGAMYTPL